MSGKRVVLVGGLAPSMFEGFNELTVYYKRITIDELKEVVKDAVVLNYIRHESTVKLLSNVLGIDLVPNTGLYKWEEGDILIIVGLKKPVRGQELQITLEDLDLVLCKVFPGRWIP
jgi:Domain of unknown function (DUF1874).